MRGQDKHPPRLPPTHQHGTVLPVREGPVHLPRLQVQKGDAVILPAAHSQKVRGHTQDRRDAIAPARRGEEFAHSTEVGADPSQGGLQAQPRPGGPVAEERLPSGVPEDEQTIGHDGAPGTGADIWVVRCEVLENNRLVFRLRKQNIDFESYFFCERCFLTQNQALMTRMPPLDMRWRKGPQQNESIFADVCACSLTHIQGWGAWGATYGSAEDE